MNRNEKIALDDLQKKVIQHEQTIAQLVRIVASMNRRMEELKAEEQIESPRHLLIK